MSFDRRVVQRRRKTHAPGEELAVRWRNTIPNRIVPSRTKPIDTHQLGSPET